MRLNLKNPIIFFDIESTGLNVATDRIVEISMVKVMPDGTTEVKTRRLNPTIHISEESTKIHGIHDEDVKDCPTFNQIAKSLAKWMEGCDIAGYNSNKFDIPVLYEEFLRAGVDFDFRKRKLVDVQNIFHKMEQRTLSAAYKFYCHKDLNNAHSAEADTMATYEILQAQRLLCSQAGLFVEPASACAYAALLKDCGSIGGGEKATVLLTGTGFKDMAVFQGKVALPEAIDNSVEAVLALPF